MGIYGLTLVGLAYAGFVQSVLRNAGTDSLVPRTLRSAWLRRFGKYSYAIYVLHSPVLAFSLHFYARTRSPLVGLALFFIGIGVSFLMGWLSWHLLESRVLRLKRYFNYSRVEVPQPAPIAIGLIPALRTPEFSDAD